MLPSSGAMQLRIQGPRRVLPASACTMASATWPSPMPPHSVGMWGSHSPARLASSRSSTIVIRYSRRERHLPLVVEPLDTGLHRVPDEGPHAGPDLLVFGCEREVDGHVRLPGPQYRPTTLPFSSMSIRSAAGLWESPGMVRMSPLTR